MAKNDIYKDIAQRTGGDIYIGVVGPVRTGKSTFIKKFMEKAVLPNIKDGFVKERATDEMPQSAAGRTVMTTEPKFIPDEAVELTLGENVSFRIKLIDCVGYLVDGALGHFEDGEPRMVMTPWSKERMPFEQAAETGTKKVIEEHSTIGILITTDGSICDIPRESYVEAEKKAVSQLKAINKPFVILLNSAYPDSSEVLTLSKKMEEEYGVSVVPANCAELTEYDIKEILSNVLLEFPVKEINVEIPLWIRNLPAEHPLKDQILKGVRASGENISKVRHITPDSFVFEENEWDVSVKPQKTLLGQGKGLLSVVVPEKVFYKILGSESGFEIEGKEDLIELLTSLSKVKTEYDKIADALTELEETGYGIVMPTVDQLSLEEPEIVKQSGGYGVKLKASAPSIHLIKANIETEVSPMVGTELQSEELVQFLLKEFEEDPKRIWETNMFGKTLHELVKEGLNSKIAHMPADARVKLSDTLQKVINEGSGGMICILL
ncbi:MAG: stage IV sporulation protein A [Ruminococcaceae bacterium]|nr:stage IV sporulation protein A [Oscillospiraceae bacterium]